MDIVQRGVLRVQPESTSLEVNLFSPILTLLWILNGGRGGGEIKKKYLNWIKNFIIFFIGTKDISHVNVRPTMQPNSSIFHDFCLSFMAQENVSAPTTTSF